MPDQELTAQQRAARAAEAAAEARRAAARHAAARRAEQDVRRRSTPERRPPALAPKAGLAYRGRTSTTADPTRVEVGGPGPVEMPRGPAAPAPDRPRPPAPRQATPAVRTAPVPDDRSGTFAVARLTGAVPAELAPAGIADQPRVDAPEVQRDLEAEREIAPEREVGDPQPGGGELQPAEEPPAPDQGPPVTVEAVTVTSDGPHEPPPPTAEPGARTGARTGLATDIPPLPAPPQVVAVVQTVPSSGPTDGLRLPVPPRAEDGAARASGGPAGRGGDAPSAVSLATVNIDLRLPVPDAADADAAPPAGAPDRDEPSAVAETTPPPRLPEPPRAVDGPGGPDATVDLAHVAAQLPTITPVGEHGGVAPDEEGVSTGPLAAATPDEPAPPGEDAQRPWLRSYPPGVPERYRYPLVPLTRFIDDAAQDFPDTTAVSFLGTDLSYRQLVEQVDRLAAALKDRDLSVGDRLAVVLPWCPQLVTVLHACWRLGVDAVLLDADDPADVIAAGIATTQPSAVVLLDSAYPGLRVHRERLTSVQHVITTGLLDGMPALRARVQAVRLKVSQATIPDADGVLSLKAIMDGAAPTATQTAFDVEATPAITVIAEGGPVSLTHHALLVGAFQARLWLPDVRAGKESLAVAGSTANPFTVGAGLTMAMLAAATLVLAEPRSGGLARTIDDARPTILVAPVGEIRRVLAPASRRRDLTSIRITLAGGLPDDPAVRTTMEQRTEGRMRVCIGAPQVAAAALAEPVYVDPRRTTATLPPPDGDVRVARADHRGIGEIEVAGPHVTGDWVSLGLVGHIDETGFVEVVGATDSVIAHADGVTDPEVLGAALRRDPAIADAVVHTQFVDDALRMVVEVTTTDPDMTPQRLQRILSDQAPTQSPPGEWRITVASPPDPAPTEPPPAEPPPSEPPPSEPPPSEPQPAEPPLPEP